MPRKSLDEIKKYNYHYTRAHTLKYKTLAYEILGNRCVCCGETQQVFLSLDHVNNDGYIDRVKLGHRTLRNYQEIVRGLAPNKFQLLCMNCNWAKRYGVCPHQIKQ